MLDEKEKLAEQWADKKYYKKSGNYSNSFWKGEKAAFIAGWDAGFEFMNKKISEDIEYEITTSVPMEGKPICWGKQRPCGQSPYIASPVNNARSYLKTDAVKPSS